MSSTVDTDTQVIVVGAGPVGLMLAGELRLGGAEVTVLEALATPTTESRASTLHARTMEIFDQRGLLTAVGSPPNDPMGHFGGIPLDLGQLATRYPGQWKVLQAEVERLLADWAGGLGADVRRGHEVVGLTVADDHVRIDAVTPDGPRSLRARYVVGCDGQDSAVRALAGIEFPGRGPTRELLRADVAGIDVPNRRFQRLAQGLAIAARRPDGVTRVMVGEYAEPAGPRTAEPTFDEIGAAWKRVTGEDISGGTPLWVNGFDNTSRLAARYRHGRVLLAGDAAHMQMPIGGQAINLGLQDAANLGWKLAAVVCGHATDELLDTYHEERHATGRHVLGNIEAQALLLLGDSDVEPARTVLREMVGYPVVRDQLAGAVTGLDVRYEGTGHPLTGTRMPHLELIAGDRATSTTELLRDGRGVVLDLSGDSAAGDRLRVSLAGWADRLHLQSVVIGPSDSADSVNGVDTLVLRPDGYVAWVGSAMDDPQPAISRWFGPGTG